LEATQSDGVDPGDAWMPRLMGGPASALKVMAWVRLLTTSDLALAVGIPKRSSRRLLYRLGRQKLVRRNRFSLAGNGGSTWIYTLSAAGARSASELLGYKVPGRRRGAVYTALLNHRLDTTRVLCSAISALSDRLVSIHTGRGLASLFTHTSRIAKYLPDATLAFRVGEGGRCFVRRAFLEVDRGTEDSRVLHDKLHALHEYYALEHFHSDFKSDRLVVLFTVPGEGRLRTIEQVVRVVRPCVRVFVRQHQECVRPETFLSGWRDPVTAETHCLSNAGPAE